MNTWQTKRLIEETLARVGSWDKINGKEVRISSENWGKVDVKGLGWLTYGKDQRGTRDIRVVQIVKKQINGKEVIRWDYLTDWRVAPNLVQESWKAPLPY
jgi:hypothetical protein